MQIFKCPVCDGKGIVPKGFYDVPQKITFWIKNSEITTVDYNTQVEPNQVETCRSCNGKGYIVEGQEYIPYVPYPDTPSPFPNVIWQYQLVYSIKTE